MASCRQGMWRSVSSCTRVVIRDLCRSSKQNASGFIRQPAEQCLESAKGASMPCQSARTSSPSIPSRAFPSPVLGGRRYATYISRLSRELAATGSLLPLYSATATARFVSLLSSDADMPMLQGTLTHISPEL